MKIKHIALMALSTAISSSALAASSNTIQFQGEVADQTCNVTINGNASVPTVLLPTVPKSQLATAAATAGQTPFTIGVSGCTAPTGSALAIKTIFVANNITSAKNMGNTGTATNVALRLVDPKAPTVALDLTGATGSPGLSVAVGKTSATYDYAVQYIAEAAGATSGTVLGSVQYSVSYQ